MRPAPPLRPTANGDGLRENARILVVDDDPDILRYLEVAMSSEGFDVLTAVDGQACLDLARSEHPSLILLDVMMPGIDGYEVCRRVRRDPASAGTPVILLTARAQGTDKLAGLAAGADDYVVKPFVPAELIARVSSVLRRARSMRDASPLTGLPGNTQIHAELEQLAAAPREGFAVAYADIDNFKAYNDRYGFVRGDEALVATAAILADAMDRHPGEPRFLGHVGGDDFVLIVEPSIAEIVATDVVGSFDGAVPNLYDEADRRRGFVTTRDRRGHGHRFPLMTISLGIATTASRRFESRHEIAQIATELKTLAKRSTGSAYEIDRRHGADEPL